MTSTQWLSIPNSFHFPPVIEVQKLSDFSCNNSGVLSPQELQRRLMMDTPKAGIQSFQTSLIQKEKHGQLVPRWLCCSFFFFFFFSDNININNVSALWFNSTGVEYILYTVLFITDMLFFKCCILECHNHWNYLCETAEEIKEMFQTLKSEDVLVPLNLCSFFPVITVDLPLKKATKPLQISIFHAVWITTKATWWCKSLPLTSKLSFPKLFPLKILLHQISPWGRVWPSSPRLQALGAASPDALQGQSRVFLGWDGDGEEGGGTAVVALLWWHWGTGAVGQGHCASITEGLARCLWSWSLSGHTKFAKGPGDFAGIQITCKAFTVLAELIHEKLFSCLDAARGTKKHFFQLRILYSSSLLPSSPFLLSPHFCKLRQTPKLWYVSL